MRETALHLGRRWRRPSRCSPSRTGTSALRGNLDEGEPYGLPGTYLDRLLRDATAAVRRGRLRLPGGRPDGRQRHQRQDHPAARRRRAVRRPLRRAAPARAGARPPRGRAAPHRRVGLADRARGARVARRGSSRSRSARSPRSATRSSRSTTRLPVVRAVGAGRQRAAAGAARTIRARPPRSHAAAGLRACSTVQASCARARPPHQGERPAVAAAMDHVDRRRRTGTRPRPRARPDLGRLTVDRRRSSPGSRSASSSSSAYGWSSRALAAGAARPGRRGAGAARGTGLGRAARRAAASTSTTSGTRADVEIDGDAELQQAVRFALFHALQAGRAGRAARDPGEGADRPRLRRAHVLGHRGVRPAACSPTPRPHAAARRAALAALDARPGARARAGSWASTGAAFPWRTIRGQECSGYWPAGTAAFHINADIADAVHRYVRRDRRRRRSSATPALELLVETARLWRSLGHHDAQGRFRIDGVTGPDEYSAIADNNVYTNLMAARNLRAAADAAERHPDAARRARRRRRGDRQLARRRRRDRRSRTTRRSAVHPAGGGLHRPRGVGLRRDAARAATRCCCTSRTSTSTASRSSSRPTWCWRCLRRRVRSRDEQKARNFDYYEPLTVRDSSLSACTRR